MILVAEDQPISQVSILRPAANQFEDAKHCARVRRLQNRFTTTPSFDKNAIWSTTSFAAAWGFALFYIFSARWSVGHEKDFGCLWMGGRMIVQGFGESLYDPAVQEQVLLKSFDPHVVSQFENESATGALGRLPYPPIQGVVYAPLGLLTPRTAQTVMVYLSVLGAVASGYALSRATAGRVWWSTATLAILAQPAFFSTVANGQNAAVTLALISLGWMFWKENRQTHVGLFWGLLAFKPTWGIAVAWIPLLLWRPKTLLTSGLVVTALVVMTLPLTGITTWVDWSDIATKFERADVPMWDWIRRDTRSLVGHIFSSESTLIANTAIGLVFAVSAIRLHQFGVQQQQARQDLLVLVTIVVTCPRYMFYDLIISTPAWLTAFSCWRGLSGVSRAILVGLALFYFSAAIVGFKTWPRQWPVESASLVGLWVWAVCHCTAAVRQETTPDNELHLDAKPNQESD